MLIFDALARWTTVGQVWVTHLELLCVWRDGASPGRPHTLSTDTESRSSRRHNFEAGFRKFLFEGKAEFTRHFIRVDIQPDLQPIVQREDASLVAEFLEEDLQIGRASCR